MMKVKCISETSDRPLYDWDIRLLPGCSTYNGHRICATAPRLVTLGTLADFLKTQETVEGKKHERQTSLSTQGSSKYPALKKTKEGSPIPESISNSSSETGQQLSKSLELSIGITPTLGEPQFAMSYAATITRISTEQSHTGTAPFSTIGAAEGAPNWPAGSGGHQIMQGGRSGQARGTGPRQGAPNQPTAWQAGPGPFRRPGSAPAGGNLLGGPQPAQKPPPPVQQQAQAPQTPLAMVQGLPVGQPQGVPQGPPAGPPGPPGGPPGGQPPAAPQGLLAGPPRPSGGLPGGQQQAVALQIGPAPQGINGAMKGVPPKIFNGDRSQTANFMLQF
jgi:hypothetical protein